MPNAFVQKLRRRTPLSDHDVVAIETACRPARSYPAKSDLIREGDAPGPVFVFLEGWGYRYKMLPEGGRQVLAFLVPGDSCDMYANVLSEMDHTIATVTPAIVASIPRSRMEEISTLSPSITKAFRLMRLVDLGVARCWITSLGRRGSVERVAHLMCELYFRANAQGMVEDGECTMPISQIMLADALGHTPVHINRVLRQLKAKGVMHLLRGKLVVTDIARLVKIAGFDESYLQHRLLDEG